MVFAADFKFVSSGFTVINGFFYQKGKECRCQM